MPKLTLKDPGANFRSVQQIKSNNDAIEAAVEKTLSRDGTAPNQMEAVLDMNSNRIINLPQPVADTEPVRLIDLIAFGAGDVVAAGDNTFTGVNTFNNPANVFAGDFTGEFNGDGSGLTNLSRLALDIAPRPQDALGAIGPNEITEALGIGARIRVINTAGTHVAAFPDYGPTIHWISVTAGQRATIDISCLDRYREYIFINASVFGGEMELDCTGTALSMSFRRAGGNPNTAFTSFVTKESFQVVKVRRYLDNRVSIEVTPQNFWVAAGPNRWRREPDGTFIVESLWTSEISAGAETTAPVIPFAFDLTNARVVGIIVQPKADGSPPPDLPPQVTKLGTTHSLSANQFAIRNPDSVSLTHPILVRFTGVTEV